MRSGRNAEKRPLYREQGLVNRRVPRAERSTPRRQHPDASSVPRIEIVAGIGGFGDHREWNSLVADSPGGSFFQTASWCVAWCAKLAPRAELVVAKVFIGDVLVGGAALAVLDQVALPRPIPAINVVTNAGSGRGSADHGGFPVRNGHLEVGEYLWQWVLDWRADLPLLLSHLDPGTPLGELAAQHLTNVGSEQCPVTGIDPGSTFEDVSSLWTKNRRKMIRKRRRQFDAAGGAFEWIDGPAHVAASLPALFRLHRARRASLGFSTGFGADWSSRAFHQLLAEMGDSTCGSWIQLARVRGEIVGALYGFRLNSTYSVYQSGWDPRWQDVSLGLVQYATALQNVVEHGATRFDMCRGPDPYKMRFATDIQIESSYVAQRGLQGHLLASRLQFSAWRRLRRNRYAQ